MRQSEVPLTQREYLDWERYRFKDDDSFIIRTSMAHSFQTHAMYFYYVLFLSLHDQAPSKRHEHIERVSDLEKQIMEMRNAVGARLSGDGKISGRGSDSNGHGDKDNERDREEKDKKKAEKKEHKREKKEMKKERKEMKKEKKRDREKERGKDRDKYENVQTF